MWYFSSPQIVFGEGSLSQLGQLKGSRAMIITDPMVFRLGLAELVRKALEPAGMQVSIYAEVKTEPSLDSVRSGTSALLEFQPDWIVAVGGGSVIDAAKAMWVLYEHPEMEADAINPIETLGLRQKARLVAVPTTSGTGSEATWAMVLTDMVEKRKLGLGNRENLPDWAILDPEMVMSLPTQITVDTGLDVLVHAVEGFTSTWNNDFCDGLCLKAVDLVFQYLPPVFRDGKDHEARVHMQNAATIAGLGFGNSMAALAHGLGHALGADFAVPHGRSVALFLPYTIEYALQESGTRYQPIARFLGLRSDCEKTAGTALVEAIRDLERNVGQPLTLAELGINSDQLEEKLDHMATNALSDTQTIMGSRVPEIGDIRKLFRAALHGEPIDF